MSLLVSTDLHSIWIDPPPAIVLAWCQRVGVHFSRTADGGTKAVWHGEGPLATALVRLATGADDEALYRVVDLLALLKGVPLVFHGDGA